MSISKAEGDVGQRRAMSRTKDGRRASRANGVSD